MGNKFYKKLEKIKGKVLKDIRTGWSGAEIELEFEDGTIAELSILRYPDGTISEKILEIEENNGK